MSKLKNNNYNPSEIEKKWQTVWEKEKIYSPNLDTAKKPFYNLMMFPYPSAEGMHVGNMYAFTGADVYGRFQRMQGQDVFEPIGLDGFGIHSENYAIKIGNHPVEQAKISEKNFYRQLKSIGNGFDWTHSLETYKPEYYKWTQWLFIQLFKAGLAYRKKAPVNFCPSCKTVLADEQVITKVKAQKSKLKTSTQNSKVEESVGVCERCETPVEKRDLEQWFFRITKYADRLLANIDKLDWSEKVKIAQREWIGRSEGQIISFPVILNSFQDPKKGSKEMLKQVEDTPRGIQHDNEYIDVFTTRPETMDGATFLVLSPQHPKAGKFKSKEVIDYIKLSSNKIDEERRKEKTGVFSGEYVTNPLTKKKIPVWIADYVLIGYGTGAIMAVPAQDERDREFAEKYKIPVEKTSLSAKPVGQKVVNYHLRDWLISRQRYWGPPIPMIFCGPPAGGCGWQPVSEKDLPVELPFIEDYKPLGIHSAGSGQAVKGPLASHPEFYETKCPKCGMNAKRETDVSDTFLDSSWYFLRYVATEFDKVPFDDSRVRKWLPVNMYIGGAEHSVLHLLYSRFITMVLKDLGFINFEEPFAKFRAHGLIVKDGAKMSKSKGNVVVPDQYVKKFGADTLRTYLMFMGPFSQGGDFRDTGIEGMHRFLKRIWSLVVSRLSLDQIPKTKDQMQMMHKTIKKVTEDISSLSYNTAIAALMEWYNYLSEKLKVKSEKLTREEMETFVKLIAPFAPHVSEELYQLLTPPKARQGEKKQFFSIHNSSWPTYDSKFLVKDEFVIVVQVNGKLRGNLVVDSKTSKNKAKIEELARRDSKVQNHLEGKSVKKVIYVEGKVVNFVAI